MADPASCESRFSSDTWSRILRPDKSVLWLTDADAEQKRPTTVEELVAVIQQQKQQLNAWTAAATQERDKAVRACQADQKTMQDKDMEVQTATWENATVTADLTAKLNRCEAKLAAESRSKLEAEKERDDKSTLLGQVQRENESLRQSVQTLENKASQQKLDRNLTKQLEGAMKARDTFQQQLGETKAKLNDTNTRNSVLEQENKKLKASLQEEKKRANAEEKAKQQFQQTALALSSEVQLLRATIPEGSPREIVTKARQALGSLSNVLNKIENNALQLKAEIIPLLPRGPFGIRAPTPRQITEIGRLVEQGLETVVRETKNVESVPSDLFFETNKGGCVTRQGKGSAPQSWSHTLRARLAGAAKPAEPIIVSDSDSPNASLHSTLRRGTNGRGTPCAPRSRSATHTTPTSAPAARARRLQPHRQQRLGRRRARRRGLRAQPARPPAARTRIGLDSSNP